MTTALEADAPAYDRVVRVRWRNALITALVTVPPAAGLLVLDHRLMLLAVIVLTPLLLTVVDAARARRAAKTLGSCRLTWDAASVMLQSSAGTVRMAFPGPSAALVGLRVVRAQPDALVLVEGLSVTQVRSFIVPSTLEGAAPFLEHLRAHGVPVHREKQIGLAIAGFMMGALLYLGIGKVAIALVVAGLAQIALWVAGRAGFPSVGLGLLAGALVLLVVKMSLRPRV